MVDVNTLAVTTLINIACLLIGVLITLAVLDNFTD